MAKNSSVDSYTDMLGDYFTKLPELPRNWKDTIVKITPWLALIFGLLGVAASLAGLGIFTFFAPFAALGGDVRMVGGGFLTIILALISSALLLAAFPGTNARKAMGWKLLFFSEVAGLLGDVVSFSWGGVVFTLIAFYFLYQIRAYYK